MAWSEDVPKRFDAYGWHTQRVEDGNDLAAIEAADRGGARRRPAEPHRRPDPHRLRQPEQAGQPEGPRLAARPRRGPADQGGLRLGSGPHVLRPGRGRASSSARRSPPARRSSRTGRRASTRYRDAVSRARPPSSGAGSTGAGCPTAGTPTSRPTRPAPRSRPGTPARTRSSRSRRALPELFGGAADLSESNLTDVKGEPNFSAEEAGRNLRFGVREHGMGGDRQRHRLPRRVHPVLRARS